MSQRVVVCASPGEEEPWLLPPSRSAERTWIHGGERSLYEFSVAAAKAGFDVELRGDIVHAALAPMIAATGASVLTDLPARRPESSDIVVLPEGFTDPVVYGAVALSAARAMLLILGPPGLVGWDFQENWELPDILTVDPTDIARPETFRAMDALGFELLTNARSLAELSHEAGVDCTFVGRGIPFAYPDPIDKTHDVVVVGSNRWADIADGIAARLQTRSIQRIGVVGNEEMLRLLGSARVLPWPAPIDTTSRFMNEARAMGTVPVVLDTPFLWDVNEATGAVLVSSHDELVAQVDALLADPERLALLSERASRAARELSDWDSYVVAVSSALSTPRPDRADRGTRSVIGARLDRLFSVNSTVRALESARAAAHGELATRDEQIRALRSTRTFRYTAALRRPYEWWRRRRGMNSP
jgi:hypothetical protein